MKAFKNYMIIGAARSGIASARFLAKKSNIDKIILTDTKTLEELQKEKYGIEDILCNDGITFVFGRQPSIDEIKSVDCIILSPGVPPDIKPLLTASKLGKEILSEIEFANEFYPGHIIGITGTNGKTTTTTLTAALLKSAGYDAVGGGNIGAPFINFSEKATEESVVALELSSFQLSMTRYLHPQIAIITNLTPDHLDRHKTFENYIAAKANIFVNMVSNDSLILNYDDENVRKLSELAKCKCLFFTLNNDPTKDAYLVDDDIYIKYNQNNIKLISMKELNLLGKHNAANVMCAALAVLIYGADINTVRATLKCFKPVTHRIEYVATKKGVKYINDSKGTNPEATITAVNAVPDPLILILGGYDKHSSYDELFKCINKSSVKHIVILGETKYSIRDAAMANGFSAFTLTDKFEDAVKICSDMALPGDCVLLSPACASWDMFEDYEQRGEIFKSLVNNLEE